MKKRPVILVDLDNVVYDWTRSMANWLYHNKATQTVPPRLMELYSQWAVWEDWGIPKGEFMRWWRLGIEAGVIYGKGPLIPGAREALWRLSDAEWHIHIATSRLTKFGLHDKIVENTAQWLHENNIPYRDLSFVGDKTRIMADAIVDDRADSMYYPTHMECFEFGAPHNDSDLTWDDILSLMTEKGML